MPTHTAQCEDRQPMCCVCDDVKANINCTTCRQQFCAACTKVHTKQRVSRDHMVWSGEVQHIAIQRPGEGQQAAIQRTGEGQHAAIMCRLY